LIAYFRTFSASTSPEPKPWTLRIAKILLVFAVAIFYSFVVLNNTTDLRFQLPVCASCAHDGFHVSRNRGVWRALNSPLLHTVFYLSIIAWESATMLCSWWGAVALIASCPAYRCGFQSRKENCDHRVYPCLADVAGCVPERRRRVVPYVAIKNLEWSGCRLRMFTVIGILLLLVAQPDAEHQP